MIIVSRQQPRVHLQLQIYRLHRAPLDCVTQHNTVIWKFFYSEFRFADLCNVNM